MGAHDYVQRSAAVARGHHRALVNAEEDEGPLGGPGE
jgi:hypothetical protein